MAGVRTSENVLNKALETITKILNDSGIDDWFISYGTLLGIIREGSCIEKDDDVDINISISYRDQLYTLLIENGFKIEGQYNKPNFLKTIPTEDIGSIDLYFCRMNQDTCIDDWNSVAWNNYKDEEGNILKKEWHGVLLNVPFNPIDKLTARYKNWKVPCGSKMGGTSPYNLP